MPRDDALNVATTSKRRAALVRASNNRRPASLSLAETSRRLPDTTEVGDNSVSFAIGAGKARRLLDTEYLFELRGHSAYRTFDAMRFSDPKVAGLRFAQNLPLLRAAVHAEPAEGGTPNAKGVIENQDAADKAALVQRLLIDDYPWRSFLADTTLCMDYGFACFEIVWRIEDGEARCRLALRPSSSIWVEDIYVDGGKIDHVVQRPRDGGERTIPGERVLWFSHCKEGDDFRGRSILRAMYKPWKLKQEVEVQLAVLIGKMGGVPVFTEHSALDEATENMLDEAGASFGIAAGAFVRKPEDVDLELLASNAKVGEVLETVKYWDTQLTSVAQAQVLDLGVSQVGSRALSTTMGDMFSDSIQAQASYREDVLNAKGSIVEQLVSYNFPNTDNLPAIRFGNVQRSDILALARAFYYLGQAGMTFGEETWDWVRQEMNLPDNDTAASDAPVYVPNRVTPAQAEPTAPADSVPAKATAPVADGAQASEAHTHDAGLQLAERRPPRGVELYLDLAELVGRFDDAKTAVRIATQATRDALAKELAKRATAAAAKGQLAKFAAEKNPPMVDRLTADISKVLADFYAAGKTQVTDELARQKSGKPWTPTDVGMRVKAAEKPRKKAGASSSPEDPIALQAEATARSIALQAQAVAVASAGRVASGVPVDEAAVETAIIRESDAAALRFAGVVSDLMSLGRTDEMADQAQEIADYVYSALLDGATCSACEPMDGEVTTDATEAESWCPNPECEGGDRCRCLVVAEISQDTGATA